jgi:hypothetical protein
VPGKEKGNGKEAGKQKVEGAPSTFDVRASLAFPLPLP